MVCAASNETGEPVKEASVPGDIAREPERVVWMDGLRGAAAVQVVLLHYATAFFPAIGLFQPRLAHFRWELRFIQTPLFYPFDGYSAVYLFFVLSGVALTYSFGTHPLALLVGVRRRIIRLGIPMLASILLAALLWRLLPDQHAIAAGITGSGDWLGTNTPGPVTIANIAHQVLLEGMAAGYRGTSMLPGQWQLLLGLRPPTGSFNPPLWTLHIEFYGSLLVLLLVAVRALSPKLHVALCVLVAILFAASPVVLFLVGHVASSRLPSLAALRRRRWLGPVVGLVGILLCSMQTRPSLNLVILGLYRAVPAASVGPTMALTQFQAAMGAAFVFFGVAMTPACRSILTTPMFRWLGKISFALYLVQFPLLFTVVCGVFNVMYAHYSYIESVTVSSLLGIGVSFAGAALFARYVDGPAILLSRGARRPTLAPAPAASGSPP